MPFDPTSFANLFAFDTFTSTVNLTFGGSGAWAADTHDCPTWSDPGHILGSTTCPGWEGVPNPDTIDLSAVAALGADFLTARIVTAISTFDVGSDACKLEVDGGGCLFRDPDPAQMIWEDQRGEVLAGVQDDGTSNGSGPFEVDGLALTGDLTGPDRLVNQHPPAYYGIDATNGANDLLWRPDDFASLLWLWAPDIEVRAGGAHDLRVEIGFTLWQYIDAPVSTPGLRCWL